MKCKELRENIRDLANGRLDDSRHAEAQAHIAGCESCAARLETERRLTLGLRELAASHVEARPSAGTECALQAAFRTRAAEAAVPARAAFTWRWVAVAAGAVLALIALYGVTHQNPPQTVKNIDTPHVQPSPVAGQNQHAPVPTAFTPQKPKPVRRPVPVRVTEQVQVVTVFYPIPYAEPLRPEESKRIVRVRVPRSAIVAFGLPVVEERAQEPVTADVLVGEDNLARAIRFVGDWRLTPAGRNRPTVPKNVSFVR